MKKKLALLTSTLALTTGLIANQTAPKIDLSIKGQAWQLFGFNQEIDLKKTFAGTPVKIIWAWDNRNESWVSYSPEYSMKMALEDANHTVVNKLHQNQGFWIQSYEDVNVSIQEVFYPLYDMCVNVNSDLFWEKSTDKNGEALTSPDMKCNDFIATLPQFQIVETNLVVETNKVQGYFKTNMPVVFAKNLNTNVMVAVDEIADADLNNFFDANGSIYDISFENNSDSLTDFNFTLSESIDLYTSMRMYVGNSNKVEDSIMLEINFPTLNENQTN